MGCTKPNPFSQEIYRDKAAYTSANKLSHQWAVPQVRPIASKLADRRDIDYFATQSDITNYSLLTPHYSLFLDCHSERSEES